MTTLIDWLLALDWYVLLTPLLLAPVFLLLVFVGCADILGIQEGTARPPVEDPSLTFQYAAGLPPTGVIRIGWQFEHTLEHENGGEVPPTFNPGPHLRGEPFPQELLLEGDIVDHGPLGGATGGTITCTAVGFVEGDGTDPSLTPMPVSKSPGDVDYPQFFLSASFELT